MAFLHTFSIVARDIDTGNLGVAVQTHWFAVGSMCPWIEAGVGAVATQSMVEVGYGPKALKLLRSGKTAHQALSQLTALDKNQSLRQVAIVDSLGRIAVHTGDKCIAKAGHQIGDGFSVQANMMVNDTIWSAMFQAYVGTKGDLAERMLSALQAGQSAGGDIRGQQSAALLVADGEKSKEPWQHSLINLRVDDHLNPIQELKRLLDIHRAYHLMNEGDKYLAQDEKELARENYQKASQLAPEHQEIQFWQAVTLADTGNLTEALPIFKELFFSNANWFELVQRLPASGLLRQDQQMMEAILGQQTEKR